MTRGRVVTAAFEHHEPGAGNGRGHACHAVLVVCRAEAAVAHHHRHVHTGGMPWCALAQVGQLAHQRGALGAPDGTGAFGQRLPSGVTDETAHEPLGGHLGAAFLSGDGRGTGGGSRPPRLPRHRCLVHGDARDELGMAARRGECHVAAVAVPDDDGAPSGEQVDEIGHLRIDAERPGMGVGPAIAASVVAQHPVALVEAATELQHAGGPIHRTVHDGDERMRRVAGFLAPDARHAMRTMRSTSVLAPLGRSGAPASTSTVSPVCTRPLVTARSVANQTRSSVVW